MSKNHRVQNLLCNLREASQNSLKAATHWIFLTEVRKKVLRFLKDNFFVCKIILQDQVALKSPNYKKKPSIITR